MTCLVLALVVFASVLAAEEVRRPVGEPRVYKRLGDRELRLHLVLPKEWRSDDHRSVIVFFHGGGWVNGTPAQFNEQCSHFASRGLVGVLVEYRLVSRDRPEPPLISIHDARSAVRWLRMHAHELGIDPGRIAAAGGSAGGQLAAHAGMVDALDDPADDASVPAKPDALVLFNPVLDNGPGGFGTKTIGDRYREFSPAHNVSPDDPPTIVFVGSEDKLLPVAVLENFRAEMTRAGVRCDLVVYDGQGHGFFNYKPENLRYYTRTLAEADKFLVSLGWLKPQLMSPAK